MLFKFITKIITYLDLLQFCIRPAVMATRSLSQNVTYAHFKTTISVCCGSSYQEWMKVGNLELNRIKYINSYLISRFKRPDLQVKKPRRLIQNLSQNLLQVGDSCLLDFQHSFIHRWKRRISKGMGSYCAVWPEASLCPGNEFSSVNGNWKTLSDLNSD